MTTQGNHPQTGTATAVSCLLIGGIIMGFSPVFVREADVGPFASAFWRVLFALPILYLWFVIEQRRKTLTAKIKFTPTAVLAGVCFAGDLAFWHLAILHTTMANATFIVGLAPVWVALLSGRLVGERTSKNGIIGLGLCLAGIAFLMQSSFEVSQQRLLGDIFGMITSFFLGGYFLAMRNGRRTENGGSLFLSSTIVTAIVLLATALAFENNLLAQSPEGWANLIGLGVLTHAGGQGLVTFAIGTLTALFSSLVIFIEAIAAAFFGWLIFEENMTPPQIAGSILIILGIWLARPVNDKQKNAG